jgi:hypothetical protein
MTAHVKGSVESMILWERQFEILQKPKSWNLAKNLEILQKNLKILQKNLEILGKKYKKGLKYYQKS